MINNRNEEICNYGNEKLIAIVKKSCNSTDKRSYYNPCWFF